MSAPITIHLMVQGGSFADTRRFLPAWFHPLWYCALQILTAMKSFTAVRLLGSGSILPSLCAAA